LARRKKSCQLKTSNYYGKNLALIKARQSNICSGSQAGSKAIALPSNNALGRSYRDGRPVKEVIIERIPATLTLVGIALLFSFTMGLLLGVVAIVLNLKNKKADSALTAVLLALYSAPNFWLAFIALAFLASPYSSALVNLPILGLHPPGAEPSLAYAAEYLLLPAIILSSRRMAKVALYVRALAIDELGKEYVVTALAKGLSLKNVITRPRSQELPHSCGQLGRPFASSLDWRLSLNRDNFLRARHGPPDGGIDLWPQLSSIDGACDALRHNCDFGKPASRRAQQRH
jgi:hypothetical protein